MTDAVENDQDNDDKAVLARLNAGGYGPEGLERKQHLAIYVRLAQIAATIDAVTALAAPPAFRGEGGKTIYADMIGLNDDICLAALKGAARRPIEARLNAYRRFLKDAYDIDPADLDAWVRACIGEERPARRIDAPIAASGDAITGDAAPELEAAS